MTCSRVSQAHSQRLQRIFNITEIRIHKLACCGSSLRQEHWLLPGVLSVSASKRNITRPTSNPRTGSGYNGSLHLAFAGTRLTGTSSTSRQYVDDGVIGCIFIDHHLVLIHSSAAQLPAVGVLRGKSGRLVSQLHRTLVLQSPSWHGAGFTALLSVRTGLHGLGLLEAFKVYPITS